MSDHRFCSKRFLDFIAVKHLVFVLGYQTMPPWATQVIHKVAKQYKEFKN